MAIGLESKRAIVAEVNETAARALSLVIADARGCTAAEMTALRKDARENGIALRVVRNTLARRALAGTEYECASAALTGFSLFGFSMEDPGAVARLFKDFAAEHKVFEVTALAFGGQLLGREQLSMLASMPTRNQAIAMLMRTMQAPAVGLLRCLHEIPGKLVRTVAAVRDQQQEQAAQAVELTS